jgi:endoglucanase
MTGPVPDHSSPTVLPLVGLNPTPVTTIILMSIYSALSTVKNPDGSTTNLIFDIHEYLDFDFSGTHA